METITGFKEREGIFKEAAVTKGADGVVFGRSDFCGSMGLSPDSINEEVVTEHVLDVARHCSETGKDLVVGGGVSVDSLEPLRRINDIHLTRFETRKLIFKSAALGLDGIGDGLREALRFEILWLLNKREYYGAIHTEDAKRIATLESRWGVMENAPS